MSRVPTSTWTAEKVKSMFGGTGREIKILPTPILHLAYQTAFVDDDGKLEIRRNVYNVDSRTLAAIKGDRAIVEPSPAPKHHQEVTSTSAHRRAAAADPGAAVFAGGGLFQSLFFAGPSCAGPRHLDGYFSLRQHGHTSPIGEIDNPSD